MSLLVIPVVRGRFSKSDLTIHSVHQLCTKTQALVERFPNWSQNSSRVVAELVESFEPIPIIRSSPRKPLTTSATTKPTIRSVHYVLRQSTSVPSNCPVCGNSSLKTSKLIAKQAFLRSFIVFAFRRCRIFFHVSIDRTAFTCSIQAFAFGLWKLDLMPLANLTMLVH